MNNRRQKYLTSSRKYDVPLYCAGWVEPPSAQETGAETQDAAKTEKEEGNDDIGYVVLGGGGGDRRNGVRNSLVLARYDPSTDTLSESIYRLSTDDDPPYRLTVHPNRHEIMCSFSNSCRLFDLVQDGEIKIIPSDKELDKLENIGEQNRIVFSVDGRKFAAGGEDGHLRVFEWPSLELLLDRSDAHKSIKDLDFSLDGAFLASTGDNSSCKIWDLATSSLVTSLSSKEDGNLGLCRFSRDSTKSLLFITTVKDEKGYLTVWNAHTWRKLGVKKLQDEPISAFSTSANGTFLAIEGNISIVQVRKLTCSQRIKGAHMVFVTSLDFSRDSRSLLSVSADSSARVTKHEMAKSEEWQVSSLSWLVFLLAVIVLLLSLLLKKEDFRSRFLNPLKGVMEVSEQSADSI
ncbi:hypothetical protein O6H91_17G015500 [Diphasiastrum complanatum]|uniref:Uncharacterized protein n=1 Tax=Diphasiastrum complanatum TaxID=34168 RepID=A0ACC2B4J8_DIPCM|nr:hypothetical protein O6H91_17G015500 [Diphasiastrum complanatum]